MDSLARAGFVLARIGAGSGGDRDPQMDRDDEHLTLKGWNQASGDHFLAHDLRSLTLDKPPFGSGENGVTV